MKKILLLLLSCFLVGNSFGNFDGTFTEITSIDSFTKKPGVQELRVYEDYPINIFSSNTITENLSTCNGNNCPCGASPCTVYNGFNIDGTRFTSSHSKHIRSGEIRRDWYNYADGIESRVEYLENSYTTENGNLKPNQSILVRRYYIVRYKHDTSAPTCGDVNYYDDVDLTTPFSYTPGQWLIEPKYFTMVCEDSQTGCFCDVSDSNCQMKEGKVISTPQLLGHKIQPSVSFTNNVILTDLSCQPGGSFPDVLYDLKAPQIDISLGGENFNLNQESLRVYDTSAGKLLDGVETYGIVSFSRSGSINKIAGDTRLAFEVEDSFLVGSVHGVSGLKDYNFRVTRLRDQSFNSITPQEITSCGKSDTFTTEYNPTGSIEISDTYGFDFDCMELLKSGEYEFSFSLNDWAGNKLLSKSILNIYPDIISIPDSSLVINNPGLIRYANNIDSYDYEITFRDQYGNPVSDRLISNPVQSIISYTGGEKIELGNGSSALKYFYPSSSTDKNGKYLFSVRSLYPGTFTHRFLLNYSPWDNNYIQNINPVDLFITNNTLGDFNKPFSANIVFQGPGDAPELGTEHDYDIDLNNIGNITNISNSNLSINSNTLNFSSGHKFSDLSNIDNTFSLNNLQCNFSGIFNASGVSSVLDTPEIDINNMNINYILAGEQITYPLDSFGITGCDVSTIGLKTIGTTQGDGKGEITGGQENFSDVGLSILRSQIRENAYTAIRGLNSGDLVNGVKYVEGDTSISGSPAYETLIVKNGNVFISGNLNLSENTLGIIVLKDEGYDVVSDYNTQGNIYIGNTVETINAQLYADGALRSASQSGIEYADSLLGVKLRMKGSLFTRNTIGGGILAGGDYVLPGGVTTTDQALAFTYDLNYIRRAQVCGEIDDYSFLIEYDPTIQLDPPKGFEIY